MARKKSHHRQGAAKYRKDESQKYMSRAELGAFFHAAHAILHDYHGYLFFATMYLLGLRITEATLLRYEHIGPILKDGWPLYVSVPTLKRAKDRHGNEPLAKVPVLSHPEILKAAFSRDFKPADKRKCDFLFPGGFPRRVNKPISRVAATNRFHVIREAAFLADYYTPHVFRHTASSELHRTTKSMKLASSFLRHSTKGQHGIMGEFGVAAVTNRYVHVSMEAWAQYRGALDLPPLKPLVHAYL